MSRAEDFAAERIDRKDALGARKARMVALDGIAERAIAVPMPSQADSVTFLRMVAGHALSRLSVLDSRHHASSYFAALSRGDDFRSLARSLAMAEAERVFPANDGPRLAGDVLASGLRALADDLEKRL